MLIICCGAGMVAALQKGLVGLGNSFGFQKLLPWLVTILLVTKLHFADRPNCDVHKQEYVSSIFLGHCESKHSFGFHENLFDIQKLLPEVVKILLVSKLHFAERTNCGLHKQEYVLSILVGQSKKSFGFP